MYSEPRAESKNKYSEEYLSYDFLEGQSENEGVRLGGNPLFPCGFATGTGKPLGNVGNIK